MVVARSSWRRPSHSCARLGTALMSTGVAAGTLMLAVATRSGGGHPVTGVHHRRDFRWALSGHAMSDLSPQCAKADMASANVPNSRLKLF
jgi:hypothetical protein